MNDVYNHTPSYLVLFEFYFQLVLTNMSDDNKKNHRDFLESIMTNLKKKLK